MTKLGLIIKYIISESDEIPLRLIKLKWLLYLTDWKSCIEQGCTMTGIEWDFKKKVFCSTQGYQEILNCMKDNLNEFIEVKIPHSYYKEQSAFHINKKPITNFLTKFGYRDNYIEETELSRIEEFILNHVVNNTANQMNDSKLIRLCYSTFPMVAYEQTISPPAMSEMAKEYIRLFPK